MNLKKRWMSAFLALAMLLSMTLLPAFATESTETEDGEAAVSPFEEYVERFDGKALSDVAVVDQNTPSSAQIGAAQVDEDTHDRVLQMDFTAEADAEYYLYLSYQSNQYWPFTEYQMNADGTLTGYANSKKIENAKINRTAITDGFLLDGKTYYVVTGEFLEAYAGYQGNISQPLVINNPAFESREGCFTIETDLYLSSEFATVRGVTGRISVLKPEGGTVRLELFALTSSYGYAVLDKHNNSNYCEGGAVEIKMGEWHRVTLVVDRQTAQVTALLDGVFAFTAENNGKSSSPNLRETALLPLSIAPATFQLEINRMNNPNDIDGFFQIDNILMYHGAPAASYQKGSVSCNFEHHVLGHAPTQGVAYCELEGSTVANNHGSKAWNVPLTEANVGKLPRFSYEKVVYDKVESLVFSADYFIEAEAKGQLLGKISKMMAFKGSAASATRYNSGIELYALTFAGDGSVTLSAGTQSETLGVDRWINLATVFSLTNGSFDLYVDGELKFDDVQLYDGTNLLSKITVFADALMLCAVGANQPEYAGNAQIDNVEIYYGSEICDVESAKPLFEDFEAYAERDGYFVRGEKMPALATYASVGGNTVIRMDIAPLRSEDGYALLHENADSVFAYDVIWNPEEDDTVVTVPESYFFPEEEFDVEYDEEKGLYYILCDEGEWNAPDIRTYYIVPNNVAENAFVTANVGRGIALPHGRYSYAETPKVLLESDYFFSAGSCGTVASTLEGFRYGNADVYGESLITFWAMDAATGAIADTEFSFRLDRWNNVKVILDLVSGAFDVYVNDAYAYSRESGRTNITFGTDETSLWNVVTSVPHAGFSGVNAGEVMIDNVRVDKEIPEERSQYDDNYLTDAAYFSAISAVLATEADASIRLERPTGLRFATKIDDALLAEIESKFTVVGMGTLIAPTDYVSEAGALSHEALFAAFGESGYLDVAYQGDFEGAAGVTLADGRYFTASIVKIKEDNYARDFSAVGYLVLETAEGETVTLYSEGAVANAKETAERALALEDAAWTEEELSILGLFTANSEG